MIAKNWMKWAAGTVAAALVLAAMPAVGQARVYTGKTPASIATTLTHKHAKLTSKHKKLSKHSKHHLLSSKHHHASKSAKIKA